MRGRKPKQESRAAEIRAKLAAWKRTPEGAKPSLRTLAREIGTSHQLLSHYLQHWAKWQSKEYRRLAANIRESAKAENRSLTAWEEHQARAYDQTAFRWTLVAAMENGLNAIARVAKKGRLGRAEVKILKLMASQGYAKAQKILETLSRTEKSKNNLPVSGCFAAKSFRSRGQVAGNSSKTVPRTNIENPKESPN